MAGDFNAQRNDYQTLQDELKALYPKILDNIDEINKKIIGLVLPGAIFDSNKASLNALFLMNCIKRDFFNNSEQIFTLLESYIVNFVRNIQYDDIMR